MSALKLRSVIDTDMENVSNDTQSSSHDGPDTVFGHFSVSILKRVLQKKYICILKPNTCHSKSLMDADMDCKF